MTSRQKCLTVRAQASLRQKDALMYAKAALALSKRQGLFRANRVWRELWKVAPQVQMYYVALQAVIVSPCVYLILVYLQPSWLSVVLIFLVTFIGGGVAERILRLYILRRARLLPPGEADHGGDT